MGFWVAGHDERVGQRRGPVRPRVTCRSSIASSSAAWVFGGVRLISSASSRLANTGPARNSNSAVRASYTSDPVTSPGIRSGVNCTRLKSSCRVAARLRTSSVLATPGTPSSRTWPRQSSAMTSPLTTASCPTTALEISVRSASSASRAVSGCEGDVTTVRPAFRDHRVDGPVREVRRRCPGPARTARPRSPGRYVGRRPRSPPMVPRCARGPDAAAGG